MSKLSIWAIVISAAYFASFFLFNPNLVADLKALELNAFGDFFAGAFAPLAFGWLVVAVFIQAAELKAQREELAETRKEVELATEEQKQQREVMTNQAAQAEKQAQYIGKQTKLLEIEHQKRESDEFAKLTDLHVQEIAMTILEAKECLAFQITNFNPTTAYGDTGYRTFGYIEGKERLDMGEDPYQVLRGFSLGLQVHSKNPDPAEFVQMTPHYPEHIIRLVVAIEAIEEIIPNLPDATKLKLETMGFFRLASTLLELLKRLGIDPTQLKD